jgi:hypothetical protein
MFESKPNHYFSFAKYGLFALWFVAVISVLLLETTPLELNVARPKAFVYLNAVFGLPFVLTFWLNRQFRLSKAKTIIFGSALFVSLLAVGVSSLGIWFVFAKLTVWKTTSVFYRHKDNPQVLLAEQMKDVGALGYRRRFVQTVELTSFLSYTFPVDERSATEAGAEWTRVDESRNVFGWKGV